jgi:hypothetical protein
VVSFERATTAIFIDAKRIAIEKPPLG